MIAYIFNMGHIHSYVVEKWYLFEVLSRSLPGIFVIHVSVHNRFNPIMSINFQAEEICSVWPYMVSVLLNIWTVKGP
jgi:hypothetical protein